MLSLASLGLLAALAPPQGPDLDAAIQRLCSRSGGLATSRVLGRSAGDRPIHVVTVAAPGDTAPADRPALLVLAGLDGTHRLGTDLALAHLEHWVDGHANADEPTTALLTEHTLHVIPVANPDGRALGRIGNARAVDRDRDGRADEDGPADVDGDGATTWMRWRDPEGTYVLDDDDPRVLRLADRDAGERGIYRIAREARDLDGDGDRAEDAAHGIEVHRNFSHRFEEFDRRTGPWPMSEPETRAVADFVYAHRNLVLAFVYDRHDNLLGKPPTDKPKPRVQLNGVLDDDATWLADAGETYRELTGRSGEKPNAEIAGTAWAWLQLQVGVRTFATDVWRVPAKPTEHETWKARLAQCEARGTGFVEWRAFDHPELGAVEIGGFVEHEDWKLLGAERRVELFDAHHEFIRAMTAHLPDARIVTFDAERLDDRVHRVRAVVENRGRWPVLSAGARRVRRFSAPRLELDLGAAAIVAGRPRHTTAILDGVGGRQEFEWILTAPPDTVVGLELTVDPVGRDRKEVTL